MSHSNKSASEIFSELDELFSSVGEYTPHSHDDGTFSCTHPSAAEAPVDLRFNSLETCRIFCLHLNFAFISGVKEGGQLAIRGLYFHNNSQDAADLCATTIHKAMKGH